jgi:hypothetical protein
MKEHVLPHTATFHRTPQGNGCILNYRRINVSFSMTLRLVKFSSEVLVVFVEGCFM